MTDPYQEGQCDYCGKTTRVQLIVAPTAVTNREAEEAIRKIVETRKGQSISFFPKLCSDCFVQIARSHPLGARGRGRRRR